MTAPPAPSNKKLAVIKARRDFVNIQNNGTKWISKNLIFIAHEGITDSKRVGFVVSKKTDKSAVNRNRIKRRLRAVANEVLQVESKPKTDYVLIGRRATLEAEYSDILRDLRWCLKRTGFSL